MKEAGERTSRINWTIGSRLQVSSECNTALTSAEKVRTTIYQLLHCLCSL